ncbi:hypothetical protein [Nonomuraea turcica]|uniref:hypothetical protein n=1 Tax=Nonomuraea sp. G32 TaxID=3067274 RepID=UPI00273BED67|nr:hypothetical protein [Nonomuraea sp. G32]MDP4506153.1 hypothetical protein [Nonomuraea sp. G32]
MAGNSLLKLTPVFGAAAVAIYLIGYEQTANFASTGIRRPLEEVLAAQRVVTDVVMEPTAFACVFFTLAALSFWHLARARPTSRVLLVAGLLTPPYLLGLYVVGKANPANHLLRLGREAADDGHSVAPEVIGLGWSPAALAVVLAAAAIAQVWGVLRLARGLGPCAGGGCWRAW